ncbi:matrix metalloproteinase-24 isoform X1 [Hydra vulgaris]|uniref:matrix metalloproteinase-24 isoform X1 n=1 Tax=Hydra vulgaris TaxID=6087 RepID=UPI001F5FD7C0|nr:matrix metalloproteinase-24 [Hydra vulgaris]
MVTVIDPIFFGLSLLFLKSTVLGTPLINNEEIDPKSIKFLLDKGYLKTTQSEVGQLQQRDISGAIKRLQSFAKIPITGQLDAQTREYISKPRCGMPDITSNSNRKRKRKYLLQGTKWFKQNLTWAVENDNNDGISRTDVRNIMRRSFEKWAAVTNLKFIELEKRPVNSADIRVSFEIKKHGDPYAFDGEGGTLAHAFYPLENTGLAGDCHFDDDEVFTIAANPSGSQKSLLWVAVHELGHSIGLEHSDVRGAIMYPWYTGFKGQDFDLTFDDISGIQSLYGYKVLPTLKTTYTPVVSKDVCPTYIGAILRIKEGKTDRTLVFNKEKYYRLNHLDFGVEDGPYVVSSKFEGVTYVDAAFTINEFHYLFYGDSFSVFNGWTLYKPARKISDGFHNLEAGFRDVDAALVIDYSVYFFKGEYYWRFTLQRNDYLLDSGYPKKIVANWYGLPNYVDAAFKWTNGELYFFKGSEYYRVNKNRFNVEYGYPVKLSESFLKCNSQGDITSNSQSAKGHTSSYFVLLITLLLIDWLM